MKIELDNSFTLDIKPMIRRVKTFLFFFFISFQAFAQVADGSLFRETMSINPAVISKRPAAVLSLLGKIDKVKKEQDLATSNFGADTKSTTDVKVNEYNFFYGGKAGGFLTSELQLNQQSGTQTVGLANAITSTNNSNNVSASFANLGMGLGSNLGLTLGMIKFKSANEYNFSFMGQTYTGKSTSDTTAELINLGFNVNLGLDLGLYGKHYIFKGTSTSNGVTTTATGKNDYVGAGFGNAFKGFHWEVAYERQLKSVTGGDPMNPKTYHPNRTMLTLEMAISKLSLGYTGFYNVDGYGGTDNMLMNSLVYGASQDEARFEHHFNFAYGEDHGNGISGSIGYSKTKTQEKTNFTGSTLKFPTTTTAMGASAKYTYAF